MTSIWGTAAVLAAVIAIVALVIYSVVRDKKSGKPACGGDCAHCGRKCGGRGL